MDFVIFWLFILVSLFVIALSACIIYPIKFKINNIQFFSFGNVILLVGQVEWSRRGGGRRHRATPACWRVSGSLRLWASLWRAKIKPPLSNKGGRKNKRQWTFINGKRYIYKVKLHFIRCDIKSIYFT